MSNIVYVLPRKLGLPGKWQRDADNETNSKPKVNLPVYIKDILKFIFNDICESILKDGLLSNVCTEVLKMPTCCSTRLSITDAQKQCLCENCL